MSENTESFKVVDKRRFDESGEAKVEAKAETKVETKTETEQNSENIEITFPMFFQSLAHQVFMSLGLAPWPDSGLVKKDMLQARQTIDIMTMLSKKTEGNLEGDEAKMVEGLLYELRMTFMRVKEGSLNLDPNAKN